MRLGSTSRAASPEILAELRRLVSGKPFDEEARPDVTLSDLDQDRLHAALDPWKVSVTEGKLENLGVLTEYQGRIVATNGGVILFAPNRLRRRLFADARVEGARFAGRTRAGDILDTFDGAELTVLEAVEEMERFIARNTRRAEPIPQGAMRRAPLPEYGSTMLRELLVNAIAHADYAAAGETVKVFIFDDRIELHSPGLMLPGMTVDELKRGRSKIRNRAIASVFREIRLMERFGTAWSKIQDDLAAGYPEPTFDDSGPVFQSTLWPHSRVSQHHELRDVRDVRDAGGDVHDARDHRRDGARQAAQRERQAALLQAIGETGGLTLDELVQRSGVSRPTVQRDLRALRESAGVRLQPDGRYRAV